jgi:hypothetical protein
MTPWKGWAYCFHKNLGKHMSQNIRKIKNDFQHWENWEWYEIGISKVVYMGYKPSTCVSGDSIVFVVHLFVV